MITTDVMVGQLKGVADTFYLTYSETSIKRTPN